MVVFNPSCQKVYSFQGYIFHPRAMIDIPDDIFNGNTVQTLKKRGQLEYVCESLNYPEIIKSRRIRTVTLSRHCAMGDVVFVTALIEGIRKAYPDIKLYLKTSESCYPVVKNNPNINVLTSPSEFEETLRITDLHIPLDDVMEKYEDNHIPNVDRNRIEILFNHVGLTYNKELPKIFVEQELTDRVYKQLTYPKPHIAICHQSLRKEKSLSPDKFIELIRLFKGESCTLFDFGVTSLDYKQDNLVRIDKDISSAMAWMIYMDVAVTLDSLWSHVVASFNIPQVLLTSCTDGKLLSKDYPNVTVLHGDKECYPCFYRFEKGGCHQGEYPSCLGSINVLTIKKVIEEKL